MLIVFDCFSAAHCFKRKNSNYVTPPQYVSAFTGKFNLSVVNEPESIEHSIWDVIIHPEWNSLVDSFDADMSVVVLYKAVEFTNKLVPICLPQSIEAEIVGVGIVVGWGKSNVSEYSFEKFSQTPNQLEIPAVNQSHCFSTVPGIEFYRSSRTFCGGYLGKSKATCTGDSGGGFYLRSSERKPFNLAGIVSASMTVDSFGTCDVEVYSLFTNVAKFVRWIYEKIEETRKIKWESVNFECKEGISIWERM